MIHSALAGAPIWSFIAKFRLKLEPSLVVCQQVADQFVNAAEMPFGNLAISPLLLVV